MKLYGQVRIECSSCSCVTVICFFSLKNTRYSKTYRASVWFFTGVSAHVHNQHVLRLEGFLLPRALLPPTDERLLVRLDVILVQVLQYQEHHVNKSSTLKVRVGMDMQEVNNSVDAQGLISVVKHP